MLSNGVSLFHNRPPFIMFRSVISQTLCMMNIAARSRLRRYNDECGVRTKLLQVKSYELRGRNSQKKTVEIRDSHPLLPTACVPLIKKYVQAFLCVQFYICVDTTCAIPAVQIGTGLFHLSFFVVATLVATRVENINRRNDTGVEIMFSRNYVALNSRVTIGRGLSCN